MNTPDRNEGNNISLLDAVEALTSIAEMEITRNAIRLPNVDAAIKNGLVPYKATYWIKEGQFNLDAVKHVFKMILHHLKTFYRDEYTFVSDVKSVESIKTIMVLVGEAAKKMDKLTTFFKMNQKSSVTELKEYKQLQEFYFRRFSRRIDEGVLGKWILALSQQVFKEKAPAAEGDGRKSIKANHVFIDLDGIRKDTEYELFFIRKEDGSRFFSPQLIRNSKLVCDFGNYFHGNKADDPLVDVNMWIDRSIHSYAENILRTCGAKIDMFFFNLKKHRNHELVNALNKALMALMLAGNKANLLRNNPLKSCSEYFYDFQQFMKEALSNREYQKMLVYPPEASNDLAHMLLETVYAICFSLYTSMQGYQEITHVIHQLLKEANQEQFLEHVEAAKSAKSIWSALVSDYSAMSKLIKRHPNGPMRKTLDILENGNYHHYDPMRQGNMPMEMYSLYMADERIVNLRIPSPVHQENIQKAFVTDQFTAFLRSLKTNPVYNRLLIFNLQDRTSWKEHARCVALEDLQSQDDFKEHLAVVTFAKDTEFYLQIAPYHTENHADVFMEQFKVHLSGEGSGFSFPEVIRKELFPKFVDQTMASIHRIFFSGKNVLTREQRIQFIEIFYLFMQMKILDIVKPNAFSFTCKDAIDVGGAANAQFYAFLKILNGESLSESDWELLNSIIYSSPIIVRERLMLPDRFHAMTNVIRLIERTKEELGSVEFSKVVGEGFSMWMSKELLGGVVRVKS